MNNTKFIWCQDPTTIQSIMFPCSICSERSRHKFSDDKLRKFEKPSKKLHTQCIYRSKQHLRPWTAQGGWVMTIKRHPSWVQKRSTYYIIGDGLIPSADKVKAGSTKPKSSLMDQTRNCGANHKRNIVFKGWCLTVHKKRTFAASNLLLIQVHPKTSTQRKTSYVSSDSSIPTTVEPPIIVPKSSSRGSKFLDIGHPRRLGKCCDRIW